MLDPVSLGFIGVPNILALDSRGVLDLLTPVFDNRPESLAKVWGVKEKVATEMPMVAAKDLVKRIASPQRAAEPGAGRSAVALVGRIRAMST